jgi:hypothetical protein
MAYEFLDWQINVARNLAKQRRGDVPSFVDWNGSASTIGMAVLDM